MDTTDRELQELVAQLAARLTARHWTMATAESCTGGAIAAALTEAAGAYATEWKERHLGVSHETVAHFGVASCEVVSQMLSGLTTRFGVQAACAVSGIAGPTGGEPGKPVGTVYIGACANGRSHVAKCHFDGDRAAIRAQAVLCALKMLFTLL